MSFNKRSEALKNLLLRKIKSIKGLKVFNVDGEMFIFSVRNDSPVAFNAAGEKVEITNDFRKTFKPDSTGAKWLALNKATKPVNLEQNVHHAVVVDIKDARKTGNGGQ